MNCLNPTQAWIVKGAKTANGRKVIIFSLPPDARNPLYVDLRYQSIALPCGKCILCRKRRAFAIAVRALKEAACYNDNSFITLTVDDAHMDEVFPGRRLCHGPWQKFMKRLRKRGIKCRYLMCGEYGEHTHRPHYHAVLYGYSPSRPRPLSVGRAVGQTDLLSGLKNPAAGNPAAGNPEQYYDERGCWHASRTLEEVWPYGQVMCDRLNDNRVMYVAGYQLKDDPSGEWPSYVRWSRRPGLGADWFARFWTDMYQLVSPTSVDTSVIVGRRKVPWSCRYYDDKLSLISPRRYDILCACREMVGSSTGNNQLIEQAALKALCNRVDVIKARLARRTRDLVDP